MNYRRIQNDQLPSTPLLEGWLRKRIAFKVGSQFAGALLSLLGGTLILAVIYFVAYATVWFGFNYGVSAFSQLVFNTPLHIPSRWIRVISWSLIIVLFVEYIRVEQEYWTSYSSRNGAPTLFVWFAGLFGAFAALLGNLDASAKIVSDMHCCPIGFGVEG